MKRIISILLLFFCFSASAQVYQGMPQFGYGPVKRLNVDSLFTFTTVCGVPTLNTALGQQITNKAAIAYDSCNARFYVYDPKPKTWAIITGGGGSPIDTANQFLNAAIRLNDSTIRFIKGTTFQDITLRFTNDSSGVNIYNSDGKLIGNRVINLDGKNLTITDSSATLPRIKIGNGMQYIDLYGQADKIDLYNGHTLLEIIDGLKFGMYNTGTSYLKTDSIPFGTDRIHHMPNRSGTVALTSDTLSLSNRINLKVDSLSRVVNGCSTVYRYWINGSATIIDTVYSKQGLISGGNIARINDSSFSVAPSIYNINCTTYNSSTTVVTLNGNSGNADGRFDVIGVNKNSNVFVQQGIPSPNPAVPQIGQDTAIGLYTVFFPALSDSGVTNIYNIINVNGIDSLAFIPGIVQINDSTVAFCNRRGECDTLQLRQNGNIIDSLRRIGLQVSARKGGVWVDQYTDSVGAGGGGGSTTSALDQVLRNGNQTRQTYIVNDSSGVSAGSLKHFEHYPSNFRTWYGTRGTAMGLKSSYTRYNGVNPSGRPNVVWDIFSYNGGFNLPDSTNEASFRMGFESHFETGGTNLFEFHNGGEFKPRGGGAISLRLGSYYINKDNGSTIFSQQIEQYAKYMGGLTTIGDTVNFSVAPTAAQFGFRGNGSLAIINKKLPTDQFNIGLQTGGGVSYAIDASTPSVPTTAYHSFTTPIQVRTSTTVGTTQAAAIQATVGNADSYGLKVAQSGLSSSAYGGVNFDGNTSGIMTALYGRNTNSTGTIKSQLIATGGGTASYELMENTIGAPWRMYITTNTTQRVFGFGYGTSTYDSLLKFNANGADAGKAKFRYSVSIGSAEATARLMLAAGTATANSAPLKFNTGALLTTPEAGAVEMLNDSLYFTGNSGTRVKISPVSGGGSTDTTSLSNRINTAQSTANSKYGVSDTGRAATSIVTGGSLNKVRDSLQVNIDGKVTANAAITGNTRMKITYDAKGLVTAGATAATSDLSDVTGWTDYSGTSTITGFSSYTTKLIQYEISGKTMRVMYFIEGTGTGTTTSFTLPNTSTSWGTQHFIGHTRNNTTQSASVAYVTASSNVVTFSTSASLSNVSSWTTAVGRSIEGQFIINIQ